MMNSPLTLDVASCGESPTRTAGSLILNIRDYTWKINIHAHSTVFIFQPDTQPSTDLLIYPTIHSSTCTTYQGRLDGPIVLLANQTAKNCTLEPCTIANQCSSQHQQKRRHEVHTLATPVKRSRSVFQPELWCHWHVNLWLSPSTRHCMVRQELFV